MSTPNLGWMFYKNYYQDFDNQASPNQKERFFKDKNQELFGEPNQPRKLEDYPTYHIPGVQPIGLYVLYPGLTIGTGMLHETGSRAEIKLGFSFDQTTGLPCISGSGIKGVLRSAFPQRINSNKAHKFAVVDQENRSGFIEAVLAFVGINDPQKHLNDYFEERAIPLPKDLTLVDVLEYEMFEGCRPKNGKDNTCEFAPVSIYQRDVFHDAMPNTSRYDHGGFLGLGYITPHRNNPLKNPNVLPMVKILPGTGIDFYFDLKDGILTAEQKRQFCQTLLCEIGVGAKTNVGFGQLTSDLTIFEQVDPQSECQLTQESSHVPSMRDIKQEIHMELKINEVYPAKLIQINETFCWFEIINEDAVKTVLIKKTVQVNKQLTTKRKQYTFDQTPGSEYLIVAKSNSNETNDFTFSIKRREDFRSN